MKTILDTPIEGDVYIKVVGEKTEKEMKYAFNGNCGYSYNEYYSDGTMVIRHGKGEPPQEILDKFKPI